MMNYYNTFIHVSADCPVRQGVIPFSTRQEKSIPQVEYELLTAQPAELTQEELLFAVHVRRAGISARELKAQRTDLWNEFFSKPHACLRASMLPKKYGWGLHFNHEGRVTLCPMESAEYQAFVSHQQSDITVLAAMRNKRA